MKTIKNGVIYYREEFELPRGTVVVWWYKTDDGKRTWITDKQFAAIKDYNEEWEREEFVRIAMARLRLRYPFRPQRKSIVAKMYIDWMQRRLTNEFNKN